MAPRSVQALLPFIGSPIHGTFQSLLGTGDLAVVEEAVGLYRQRLGAEGIGENTAYPGVAKMLGELKESDKTLFVATAKPLKFAIPILERCGLRGYFTDVYGSELARQNTQKGDLIRAILTQHRVSAASAVMVGDRRHDIEGAHTNGVFAVGVTYGYGSAAELREAGADLLCDSLGQVSQFLIADVTQPGRAGTSCCIIQCPCVETHG